jgi:AcrR family transcriptional regulator
MAGSPRTTDRQPTAAPDERANGRTGTGRRIRGLDADERRQRRRQQLLDAALDLVATKGFANTSIEQICQTAYVGTKGFYELFESKEDCYLALLRQIADDVMAQMHAALDEASDETPDDGDEDATAERLIRTFAHALVDDPRIGRAAFGESAGISAAVERQRRLNRRVAAEFLQDLWRRGGVTDDRSHRHPDLSTVAIGVVAGLFDLVADWLHDADPAHPDLDALVANLTAFYTTARRGLTAG